jgi:hypothetical protein
MGNATDFNVLDVVNFWCGVEDETIVKEFESDVTDVKKHKYFSVHFIKKKETW